LNNWQIPKTIGHWLLLGSTRSHGKQWHTMQTVPGKLLQQQGFRLGDLNKLLRITTQPINGTTIGENAIAESTSFHR